jgi:hypothetical protein
MTKWRKIGFASTVFNHQLIHLICYKNSARGKNLTLNNSDPRAWCRQVCTRRGDHAFGEVCVLITPIDGQWDVQLVCDTFSMVDARLIFQIPPRDDTPRGCTQ